MGVAHGLDDVLIAGAPTQVAGECVANLFVAELVPLAHGFQERLEAHQKAGGTEATLQCMLSAEGVLQRVELTGLRREALDRPQFRSMNLNSEEQAGADRFAVEPHRAGPAGAVLTADVRAGQTQVVAEEVAEQRPWLNGGGPALSVDGQLDLDFAVDASSPLISPCVNGTWYRS